MTQSAGMYMARRKNARLPWIRSLPCHLPDWREIGTNPAKHAACFPLMVPSSDISIRIEKAVSREIPGMLVRMSNRALS